MEERVIVVTRLVCIINRYDNDFKIGKFKILKAYGNIDKYVDGEKNIIITGYNVPETKYIRYDMMFTPVFHSTYGWQGKLLKCKDHKEVSEQGILKYLINGPFPGIGPRIAKKILDAFGEKTIEILNDHPEELLRIPGINDKKLFEICEARKQNNGLNSVMEDLMPEGFSASQAKKIYDRFGEVATSLYKTDPWRFCEISGISFEKCDELGKKNGCDLNRNSRLIAGLKETLLQNEQRGNLGEDNNRMLDDMKKVLGNVDKRSALDAANLLKINHEIKVTNFGKGLIYRKEAYDAEMTTAKQAVEIGMHFYDHRDNEIQRLIRKYELNNNVSFSASQKEAVSCCYENPVSIITGGPGTGKTTTEKLLISIFKECGKKEGKEMTFCLLAPTGKAAKRMMESTGLPATTIDSKLQLYNDDGVNDVCDARGSISITEDVVIVDEASMLDIYKAAAIFSILNENQRLILIGDIDQLPSVGPGRVLGDLIDAGIPAVRLNCLYRQTGVEGQLIAENANLINHGNPVLKYGKGFEFIKYENDEKMAEEITKAYVSCCDKYGVEEVCCLLPTKKTPYIGVFDMNRRIQSEVNPESTSKREISVFNTIFREGDIVMNIKNNSEKGVVNGDVGTIVSCETMDKIKVVTVNFQGNKVVYKGSEDLKALTLAYALTIHKSQGSEYKCVLMGISRSVPRSMQKRNLVYTAVTRAKQEVLLFGSPITFHNCILRIDTNKRLTSLSHMIEWYRNRINPFCNEKTN